MGFLFSSPEASHLEHDLVPRCETKRRFMCRPTDSWGSGDGPYEEVQNEFVCVPKMNRSASVQGCDLSSTEGTVGP